MTSLLSLVRAAIIAALTAAVPAAAHEGHDHDKSAAPIDAALSPRATATSGPFELVAILQGGELVIYLDRSDTNAPVVGASIDVETPHGPATAGAKGGVYRLPAPWATSGKYDLIFTVTSDGVTAILPATLHVAQAASHQDTRRPDGSALLTGSIGFLAGILAVAAVYRIRRRHVAATALVCMLALIGSSLAHARDDHAEPAAPKRDQAHRLPDGALFVPKPTQRILAIRTAVTARATHRRTVELPGRIIPDPNASGLVQASVSGRLSPPPGGFPRLGTAVSAGDLLALVKRPLQAIDLSDMRQRGGELDQQISIVERRIARYEPLVKLGATAKTLLDEALLELRGLRERRAALDRTGRESEELVAPVSGVIAAANAVAGQITEPNTAVFQIADPAHLWVEALTFTAPPNPQAASARTGDGRVLDLIFQGAGLTDRSQAVPVHFAIRGNSKGLRIGQFVTVLAETGDSAEGIAVPRTAVLRAANGQTIVFAHIAAERFEARAVRVEPLDGGRVLVPAGLEANERVVVEGAELLNQIR